MNSLKHLEKALNWATRNVVKIVFVMLITDTITIIVLVGSGII